MRENITYEMETGCGVGDWVSYRDVHGYSGMHRILAQALH